VDTLLSPSTFNFDKELTVFLEMLSDGRSEEKARPNTKMWGKSMSGYRISKE